MDNFDSSSAAQVAAELAALREGRVAQPGPRCSVESVLAAIREGEGEEVGDVVAAAFEDRALSPNAVAEYVAAKFGCKVTPSALRRHRRRLVNNPDSCRCPRG